MAIPSPRQTLTVTAEADAVARVIALVEGFCEAARLARKDCLRLQLIFEEMLANTLEHGQAAPDSPITVALGCSGPAVAAEYTDRGQPFDPTAAPEAELSANLDDRPVGKLGWILIRRLCSTVQYQRVGGINRIRIEMPAE